MPVAPTARGSTTPIRGEQQESWQLQDLKERLGMSTRLETSLDSLTSSGFAQRGAGTSQGSADSSFFDEALTVGSRVRVLRGRRFRDFSTGDAGSVLQVDREAGTCFVAFDGGSSPVQVALRHLEQETTCSVAAGSQELDRELSSPTENMEQRSSTLWAADPLSGESRVGSEHGSPSIQLIGSASPGTPNMVGEIACSSAPLLISPTELPAQERVRIPPARPERGVIAEAVFENGSSEDCYKEPTAIRAELHREVARLQGLLAREAEERALGLQKVGDNVEQLRSRYGDVAEQIRLSGPPQEHISLVDARIGEFMQTHSCYVGSEKGAVNNRLEGLIARMDVLEQGSSNIDRLDALEARMSAVQAEVLGTAGTAEGLSSLATLVDQLSVKLHESTASLEKRVSAFSSECTVADVSTLSDKIMVVSTRLDALDSNLSAVQAQLSAADGAMASVQNQVTDSSAVMDTMAAKFDNSLSDLENRVSDVRSAMATIEQKSEEALTVGRKIKEVEALAEQFHAICTRVDGLASDMSNMQGQLSGADWRASEVQAKLAGTDAVLDTLAAKMDATVADVDSQAQELQSAISQVELHASEAIKVGSRMSETLTEHVKLAQEKDGLLDLIQARMEAFGEVEKRASEAMEIGQRLCKVLENPSELFKTEELHNSLDSLKSRVEVVNESIAAEACVRESAIARLEEQCRQVVLNEIKVDAARAEAARKQDLEVAIARVQSEFEARQTGTSAAIAQLRSEMEARIPHKDDQQPTHIRQSRSPSPTQLPPMRSARSAHSREPHMQAHWAAQPPAAAERVPSPGVQGALRPASPGGLMRASSPCSGVQVRPPPVPGSLLRQPSPPHRSLSPGSPLTWALPPPPQAMGPPTPPSPAWPGHPSAGVASPPLAGQALAGRWQQAVPTPPFPPVAQGASSSSLRALGQGSPAATLCSMCGNMSMDDSVMCRRCTLSHSRGRARNAPQAPLAMPAPPAQGTMPTAVPSVMPPAQHHRSSPSPQHMRPAGVPLSGPPSAGTTSAATKMPSDEAAIDSTVTTLPPPWTRGDLEKPAGTKDMGSWTASVYTPEQQQRLNVDERGNPRQASSPAGRAGVLRTDSMTNSVASTRAGMSNFAGDSSATKIYRVSRSSSNTTEIMESPMLQPMASPAAATKIVKVARSTSSGAEALDCPVSVSTSPAAT